VASKLNTDTSTPFTQVGPHGTLCWQPRCNEHKGSVLGKQLWRLPGCDDPLCGELSGCSYEDPLLMSRRVTYGRIFLCATRGGHYVVVASETSATHATDMTLRSGYVQFSRRRRPHRCRRIRLRWQATRQVGRRCCGVRRGPQGLDSTKAAIAQILFVDSEVRCIRFPRLAGSVADVHLNWSEISAQRLNQLIRSTNHSGTSPLVSTIRATRCMGAVGNLFPGNEHRNHSIQ